MLYLPRAVARLSAMGGGEGAIENIFLVLKNKLQK